MTNQEAGLLTCLVIINVLLLGVWIVGDFNMKEAVKKFRAIMRLTSYGKVPRLCGGHVRLIQSKGRMALIDDTNCEICTKRSKLI